MGAGYDYLATAAHFAAESSTGTNVNVCTTDDFTKSVDALVYFIDPEEEEMKIAYPTLLFDRNIIDGRAMMCSFLTLTIGNNQGMGDVEYGKIYDFYFPPNFLRLFDGPSCSVVDMWRILGRGTKNGGLVVGTIIKPKLGLQPKPFGEACYAFWMGGDFIKNDEPQGNQVFCQMNECIPEVVKAMRASMKETGSAKLFSANITADDPAIMIARGKYVLSQFGPYFHQEWEGMIQTTPIIYGGMNALRLPAFFENLSHSNVILTAGGGAFGHKDGPKQGAVSCRQGEEAWMLWKAGTYGDISLSDGVIEYAKTHEEIKGAFLTFQKDADQIYPGWKEKLGYTGESSVQAATFDWQKKAAAAAFVGSSPAQSSSARVQMRHGYDDAPTNTFYYQKQLTSYGQQNFLNDVGYLPDGTPLISPGNPLNLPET